MITGEIYVPDPKFEVDRLLVVEHALGEGGLIDAHLDWVDVSASPSSTISDKDYGYVPQRFAGDSKGLRPGREPVEFQSLATATLGMDYDVAYSALVDRINEVDSGWFEFLAESGLISPEEAVAMKKSAEHAYKVDILTEDNLPAYVVKLLGTVQASALKEGVSLPAAEEWTRGIWTAEEGNHLLSMNEYGNITSILKSLEHSAGRNSQLRAGIEVVLDHTIKLYAYVAWQELSTNYAHARKGKLFGPVGHDLLVRIGKDEARHHDLYQGVLRELFIHFPEDTIRTLNSMFRFPGLDMPGSKGIPDFSRRGVRMHGSAVFGLEHAFKAARSVIQKLGILDENKDIQGLSTQGQIALQELRARFKVPAEPRKRAAQFVLGKTASIADISKARREYSKNMDLPMRTIEAA